ncbi:hypothetical protein DPMN_095817 [Dreissena polymorpha]|uniref:Uncharacterized protein n=1 Tax=Dreissena polymorpha TaxID=45954 RepID=A0A9D4L777_DREPO|nr:hypothetical protein DPMN_095817 [Dreissena polymorpha]
MMLNDETFTFLLLNSSKYLTTFHIPTKIFIHDVEDTRPYLFDNCPLISADLPDDKYVDIKLGTVCEPKPLTFDIFASADDIPTTTDDSFTPTDDTVLREDRDTLEQGSSSHAGFRIRPTLRTAFSLDIPNVMS